MCLWKLGAGGDSGFKVVVGTQATGVHDSSEEVTISSDSFCFNSNWQVHFILQVKISRRRNLGLANDFLCLWTGCTYCIPGQVLGSWPGACLFENNPVLFP